MKGNGKRILSLCLAVVIAVTTVGYAPPFTSSASWKSNMEKALELLASPSEASKATPSEAGSPGREATPSEAEIPDGKATPSEAVKKFVRVEPEEIPEYYSQVSSSGKKFWKFEDRYGIMQYRDYGYLQGEAEFPLWYVTNLTGTVDDSSDSVSLDEEYYNLAPFVYRSATPDQTAWTNLSWQLFTNSDEINDYTKKKIDGFKNWDTSGYDIWHLVSKENEEEDLGYHFYGTVVNDEEGEGKPGWYYSDENGIISNVQNLLMASLATSQFQDMGFTFYRNAFFGDDYKSTITYKGSNYDQYSRILLPQPTAPSPKDDSYTGEVFLGWTTWIYDLNAHRTGSGYSICHVLWANESTKVTTLNQLTNVFTNNTFEGLWRKRSEGSIAFITDYGRSANWDYQTPEQTGYWTVDYLITGTKGTNYDFNSQYAKKPIDINSSEKHENETFVGWFTGMNGTGRRMDTYDFSGDLKVYSYFAPTYETHTVTFQDDSGNVISQQEVPHRGAAKDPRDLGIEIPKISGYMFDDWDYGGNNINLVTKDMVITAKYKNTVTLTLMGNGGLIGGSETYIKELAYNTDIYDLLNDLKANTAKPLYTFKGWYTNPEGTGSNSHFRITSDTTLYAVWNRIYNTIKYFDNYDSSDTTISYSGIKYAGDPIGKLKSVSPKKGYRLRGWSTSITGYYSLVTPETLMPTEQLVLYGQWETWMVNCNINYGIGDSRQPYTRSISSIVTNKKLLESYLPSTSSMEVPGYISTGYGDGWRDENGAITLSDYNYHSGSDRNIYFARTPKTLKINVLFPSNTTSGWESSKDFLYGKYGEIISSDNYDSLINIKNEKVYDDGRVFAGFYYDKELTKPVDFSLGLKPEDPVQSVKIIDVNVYAKYVKDFTVTFKDWDGSILSNQTVLYGESAELPEPPVRTGYRFIGWDKSTTNIQEDTVLTAQYEISSHHLTLDGNEGSLSGKTNLTMDVTTGDSLDQVLTNNKSNANRKYYTFTGWFTAPDGGSKYPDSGNLMPDTDITVYAQWERSSSEVTFKDWNGTVIDRQEILLGANATPPQAPERAGYTFIGWDKPMANIQDHTEVTAQYSINGYLLTLDGNGGTLEGSPKKEVVISFDQSFDQILKDGKDLVERPGYQFDGWYTSASGGSIYSYSGNQMPSINVTVYAHWSPNTYKVTFDPDHVRWTEGVFKEEHTFDSGLGTLPTPEIYGWKFNGWWTGRNGSGAKLTSHSMVEPKDVVYYGNWSPLTYEVHFLSKVEQPEGESVKTFTVDHTYDQAFGTLPEPEEKGYTFTGWYDGENKKINPQTIFQPQSGAEGYTYHAGWESNSYNIQFVYYDSDGKQVVIEINRDYPSRLGTLPAPEKPGYTFVGWFKDNGEQVTAGSWVEAGDTEYKAKWKANQYTIHFERNLPESETMEDPEDKTVTYALPIGALPNLNETGYVFLGWFTEPEGGTRIKETTLAALGDQTYYGHWTMGIIDNGNGTYRKPGADGTWNTTDDELWWKGPDGISLTFDDKRILTFVNRTGTYADNENGTHYRPGTGESWTSGIELWWNGPDGIPGTDDDVRIYAGGNGSSGTPIYYIDSGNGIYIRPGADGNWGSGTQYWWFGPDGTPGTSDDRQIHVLPGGGYYIDNGDGTYIRPGTGGSWTSGTEHWWYGPDGTPGTSNDRQIHVLPGGGYYIDNGDGTYIRPGTGGSWTSGTEHWWYGPDGKPGTSDDRQIHVLPGGGYYIDNGDGTYIRPGTGGSWTSGTEHWWYGPDGKPGTDDDRQIHVLPGGGYYIDNGDGTHIRPGTGGSWDHGTEIWLNGPDGKPGTPDDYKKADHGNTDPEPTKPEPTDPEPTKPDPTDPEPTKPEPTDPEPTKPEPTKPDPVKPEPSNPSKPESSNESKAKDYESVTVPEIPSIDSASKPIVRNDGGTFHVNPENPKDVTYIKPDGTPANNEWVGDGTNLYHVDEESKLNYSWFLETDNTWFMLNNDSGEQFGAALRGWYSESMDKKKYFFDPSTTKMLTGWQRINNKWHYFTEKNERKTYTGDNRIGWLFDNEILYTPLSLLDRPYGSMYRNEYTPDGYWVDENGVCIDKK